MNIQFRLLLLNVIFLSGCSISPESPVQTPAASNHIIDTVLVSGNAAESPMIELSQDPQSVTELNLSLSGFKIIAPPNLENRAAIQVCATTDKKPILDIALDESVDKSRCFHDGSGLILAKTNPPNFEVPLMITDGSAHNYYFSKRRVSEPTKTTVNINSVTSTRIGTVSDTYLVIFIDKNQDHAINKDELWFVKVKWDCCNIVSKGTEYLIGAKFSRPSSMNESFMLDYIVAASQDEAIAKYKKKLLEVHSDYEIQILQAGPSGR